MSMPTNQQLEAVPQPATVALADRVRQMAKDGRRVIALQTGDPDFATPAPIVEAAHRAMRDGLTHYSDSRGLPKLREAIAEKLKNHNRVDYSSDSEILVTCGAVHAYYCALQAILNPGDEVLIPDPAWMTHNNLVLVVRGAPVRVPALPEDDFFPTMEAWERAVSPRTRALVINSPSNPAGMVASAEYLAELSRFARRHDLCVISDETYERILYDGREHTCFASLPEARNRTLLVQSLSKTYAMTGWRVGYMAAPQSIVDQALKVSQYSITNLAPFIQHAAAFALTSRDMDAEIEVMVNTYARRRELVMRLWRECGDVPIRLSVPQGAFYLFLDARELGMPSVELSERLLEEEGVALAPGSAFGAMGEGFVRATIAASDTDVADGCLALLAWVGEISST